MAPRDRWILAIGVAAALGAVAAGSFLASGTPDAPEPPPPPTNGTVGPKPRLTDIPRLHFFGPESALPKDAQDTLIRTWEIAATSGPAETAAALDSLVPSGRPGPVDAHAPVAIRVLGPALEWLVGNGKDAVPASALRVAAELARRGGTEGRKALQGTGLVSRAFGIHATTGPAEFRLQAAWLLGIAGGTEAAEWLVVVLNGAPEPAVRARAVEALAQVHLGGTTLPASAVAAVRKALEGSADQTAIRRACLLTISTAFDGFRPWLQDSPEFRALLASTLESPDRAVRLDAAKFFEDHPLNDSGPPLVRLVADPDEAVARAAANALAEVRPEGAAEALEARLASVRDPAARKDLERAIRKCRAQ